RAWLADLQLLLVGDGLWLVLLLRLPLQWPRRQLLPELRELRVLRLKSLVFYVQRLTFKF
ncbi:hypothetical protein AB4151_26110, partial [Vibrio splendidus]|uniref:hypothetical protein n=1 Tax=Vibrio splendidus TaxID=29497 RepID=UPI001A7E0DD9